MEIITDESNKLKLFISQASLARIRQLIQNSDEAAIHQLNECLIMFEEYQAMKYANLTKAILTPIQPLDKVQELEPLTGLLLLTKREQEVAVLIGQGLSNNEIALRLYVSVRTITTHLERIYHKLELRSRWALSSYIYEQSKLLYA
jgi:DNA-binding NarL/FixJ family response regulator